MAKPATIKTAKKKAETETDTPKDETETHHERLNTDWVKDYWKGAKKDRESLCVAQFHQNLTELVEQKGDEDIDTTRAKVKAVSEIRMYLFNKAFPLPRKCKKIAWTVVILWSIAATIITIIYGLSFDLEMEAEENHHNPNVALIESSDCWNSTLNWQVEERLSKEKFLQDSMKQEALNAASYGGSDSSSWIVSIFQSLLQSLLVWDPLTVYLKTWIAVWLFTWNLEPVAGAGNVVKLCKKCCRKKEEVEEDHQTETDGEAQVAVVAHGGRPMDLISFLGNEEWIIDDGDVEVAVVLDTVVELEVLGDGNASDSASLSVQNVTSYQEGEGVRLQAITQIKSTSGSDEAQDNVKDGSDSEV
eukprot:146387_1